MNTPTVSQMKGLVDTKCFFLARSGVRKRDEMA